MKGYYLSFVWSGFDGPLVNSLITRFQKMLQGKQQWHSPPFAKLYHIGGWIKCGRPQTGIDGPQVASLF